MAWVTFFCAIVLNQIFTSKAQLSKSIKWVGNKRNFAKVIWMLWAVYCVLAHKIESVNGGKAGGNTFNYESCCIVMSISPYMADTEALLCVYNMTYCFVSCTVYKHTYFIMYLFMAVLWPTIFKLSGLPSTLLFLMMILATLNVMFYVNLAFSLSP